MIAYKYNANAILSLSSHDPYSRSSSHEILQGMYPMFNLDNKREVNYITLKTPILDTSFEDIMEEIYWESGGKICLSGPIRQVGEYYNYVLGGTLNCDNLDSYLNNYHMDMAEVERMLRAKSGNDEIDESWKELELYFGKRANNIMEYLKQLEMVIAELTHVDEDWGDRLESYEFQACYISANIF